MIHDHGGSHGPSGSRARGVTYIEMLVVAVVASVLATVAIPTGLTFWRAWKETQLRRALVQVRSAIDEYHEDWELGCIESEDEKGWPSSIEELTEPKELFDAPECTGEEPASLVDRDEDDGEKEPSTRRYLVRIPTDPFNEDAYEHDTAGWKARSYDDDLDSTSWRGEGVYDVYSSSELMALNETRYSTW